MPRQGHGTRPRYDLFGLEVVAARVRPGRGSPTTIHYRGRGVFVADGKAFRLPSAKP